MIARAWAYVSGALILVLGAALAWVSWQSRKQRRAAIYSAGEAAAAQHKAKADVIEERCEDEAKRIRDDKSARGLAGRLRIGVATRMRERAERASHGDAKR